METGNYEVYEFIMNESFQRYVLQNNKKDSEYWEKWIDKHPDALATIDSAKEILIFISNRKVKYKNSALSEEVFEDLQKQINTEKNKYIKTSRWINTRRYWVAASILVIVALGVIFKKSDIFSGTYNESGHHLEVVVPEGQRSQLLLPDGSKVWLNSGTVLKYPSNFLKKERHVYVEGEAYFDVKHSDNNPFIVHLPEDLFVKVLGTEFNVKCYKNEKIIETALVKGKVNLIKKDKKRRIEQEIQLSPNEKAVFQKRTKKFIVSNLKNSVNKSKTEKTIKKNGLDTNIEEMENITAWTEEKLVFKDEEFEEIVVKMERWYGLKITVTDEQLKKERFTGKFVNKETIYQVLDIFNRSEPIQYHYDKNELIITRKQLNTNP